MEKFFGIRAQGSTLRTEILAGVTIYVTMAYIIFVNPVILGVAGMDTGAVFVATCLAAAVGTLIMGLYANYPLALAPGMGLNAFFAYTVVKGMHVTWQVALGAVFLSGLLFLLVSVTRIREIVVAAIPRSQKQAMSAGIGFFLAIIALKNAGFIKASPDTFVTLGNVAAPESLLAAAGFAGMAGLEARRVPGAILIGILSVTAAGILMGVSPFGGIASLPPSLAPTFLAMDVQGALGLGILTIVFVLFFVDLFDSTGTLIGVVERSGLVGADGVIPRLRRVLIADSVAILIGAMLGTSTVTSYVESAAGVKVGGRTGMTSVIVAGLFLASLFLAPLAGSVPSYATAPALLLVACLLARGLVQVDWDDVTEYAPAVITAIAMPLTFSIANGIAFGFISYVAIKLLAGRPREVGWTMAILAVLFVIRYAVLPET